MVERMHHAQVDIRILRSWYSQTSTSTLIALYRSAQADTWAYTPQAKAQVTYMAGAELRERSN
jgi:hypothetical protein